jgi:CHASE2 domain-containing sensor protein
MTDILSYILLALGLVLMVTGYRRNNRNMLVWAGLILCAGAGVGDFVHGFMDGIHAGGAPA